MTLYQPVGEVRGMARNPDHSTSIRAAQRVKRVTLRDAVTQFARDAGHKGFTDEELRAKWEGQPESSLRKRRTELAQENIVLDSGRTTLNRHAQEVKVWVHRDFHHAPPPIIDRPEPFSAKAEIHRLKALFEAHSIAY